MRAAAARRTSVATLLTVALACSSLTVAAPRPLWHPGQSTNAELARLTSAIADLGGGANAIRHRQLTAFKRRFTRRRALSLAAMAGSLPRWSRRRIAVEGLAAVYGIRYRANLRAIASTLRVFAHELTLTDRQAQRYLNALRVPHGVGHPQFALGVLVTIYRVHHDPEPVRWAICWQTNGAVAEDQAAFIAAVALARPSVLVRAAIGSTEAQANVASVLALDGGPGSANPEMPAWPWARTVLRREARAATRHIRTTAVRILALAQRYSRPHR